MEKHPVQSVHVAWLVGWPYLLIDDCGFAQRLQGRRDLTSQIGQHHCGMCKLGNGETNYKLEKVVGDLIGRGRHLVNLGKMTITLYYPWRLYIERFKYERFHR